MSTSIFLVAPKKPIALLSDVAPAIFRELDVSDWEQRESSNYPPDDHYFIGYRENVEVTVCDADDDRMPDYPFHVLVKDKSWKEGADLISPDVSTVVKALVAGGFNIFVPAEGWHTTDWDGDGDFY